MANKVNFSPAEWNKLLESPLLAYPLLAAQIQQPCFRC